MKRLIAFFTATFALGMLSPAVALESYKRNYVPNYEAGQRLDSPDQIAEAF